MTREAVVEVMVGAVTREGDGEVALGKDLVNEGLGVALLFFTSDLLKEPSPPPLFLFSASFFFASLDNMVGESITDSALAK